MSTGAVGIDLGTTFSAIAHVNQHGVPEILPNAEGDRITPSVILFEDDDVIVGNYAKQAAVVYPEQVVEFVKRHMGDGTYNFSYRGKDYDPEQLSSYILAKLKHDAELRLGHRVDQAVITVPAYFNDIQRRATMRAGELAGLKVLKLINEPTAAAFAYGLNNAGKNIRVMVYDLGGGTFDVTLVDIEGTEINVVGTDGDHKLGGKDWDDRLIEHVAEAFREKHGIDPLEELSSYHDLRQKCVSAKISLTRRPKVNVFHDYGSKVLRLAVTRETFEELTADLLQRTHDLTLSVLKEANAAQESIDVVLLDLTMPDMSGTRAFAQMREIRPGVPGLFASGYRAQEVSDELADTVIYLDLLAFRLGIDLGAAVGDKFNRTSQRVDSSVRIGARGCWRTSDAARM